MARQFDLVVIGAGTAAMGVATRVRAAGRTVAVVDFRPFGGTCALRGCDPKKMLISGTSAIDHFRRMRGKGVAGEVRIDWPELMAFKQTFTDPVPELQEQTYRDKGIDTFHPGSRRRNARRQAHRPRVRRRADQAEHPGRRASGDERGLSTARDAASTIALVGGGYIAAEFSHIAALAGAEVTVLQHGDRMLKNFDADLVGWLMEKFEALGIDVRTGTSVERIEKADRGFRVWASVHGAKVSVDADLVIHSAGRAPAFDALNLEAADVKVENGRLELNEFLQSVSNPAVYAAGDAAQMGPPLTPVSSHDAKVVAANLIKGNHAYPDYRGVPSVVFTLPPIAAVGMTEEKARTSGQKLRTQSKRVSSWFTARQAAEPVYGFKVLIDAETDLILGAHLVGPRVDEVINLFALAMRHDLTAEDLKKTTFAYPTGASDIGYML
jgi:glutathione reductase (NADPH)